MTKKKFTWWLLWRWICRHLVHSREQKRRRRAYEELRWDCLEEPPLITGPNVEVLWAIPSCSYRHPDL